MIVRFANYPVFKSRVEEAGREDAPQFDSPVTNVIRNENRYEFYVELPGVKKEQVSLSLEQNVLTLKAERKQEAIPETARVLLRETCGCGFERSWRLPEDADTTGIQAELENGVMKIVLPVREEERARTIAVK